MYICRAHSPTFPSLHLRHSSFSNPSVALPMPQLILQPFCCFIYITAHSPTPSFASPTPQALHLRHLASCQCHPSYNLELTSCDFHIFLHLKKFLSKQCEHFQNDREVEMSVTQWFQSQVAQFKSCPHGTTNASIPEINMFKNSSTLPVCVLINLSIKLGFISVGGEE